MLCGARCRLIICTANVRWNSGWTTFTDFSTFHRLPRDPIFTSAAVLSQYTRVTDNRRTTYHDNGRTSQCNCNIRLNNKWNDSIPSAIFLHGGPINAPFCLQCENSTSCPETLHYTVSHNFGECWPIFILLSFFTARSRYASAVLGS